MTFIASSKLTYLSEPIIKFFNFIIFLDSSSSPKIIAYEASTLFALLNFFELAILHF